MSTTTSSRAATKPAATATTDRTGTADFARQQLATGVEAAAVLYRAAEAVQQINLQLVQRATLRQQQLAEQLRATSSAAEVMALQASLLSAGLQEATQYWQELAGAAMTLQGDMLRSGQGAAPAATGIPVNPIGPAWQAWQTMFTAPLNGAAVSH